MPLKSYTPIYPLYNVPVNHRYRRKRGFETILYMLAFKTLACSIIRNFTNISTYFHNKTAISIGV